MQKIIHKIENPIIAPFYKKNVMFIDIETNGLSHKHKLVIIGLIIYSAHNSYSELIQLFNNDFSSEREMLHELKQIIAIYDIDYYISFNGNAFDFPFLNARYQHYKIDYALPKAANIDLLKIARMNQKQLNLPDFKLKTVEQYVGINRTDVISGKDSIVLFDAYMESKSDALKNIILLHNYDDLVNMVPLLKLTENIDLNLTPIFAFRQKKIYLTQYLIKASKLECTLKLSSRLSIRDLFYETNQIYFECIDTEIKFVIECIHLKDAACNEFHFLYSDLTEKIPFDQTSDATKHKHLIAINRNITFDKCHPLVFEICETLLRLLEQ